jgi:alpha-glucosidase
VLSNHDNARHRTRYDRAGGRSGEDAATTARRSEARARAAAVLLLTLRGTPFVYQGDELGLNDADIAEDRRVDPGGRDGCRAVLPWDGTDDHGWPTADGVDTWLPVAPEADTRNRATLRRDPDSILHLYRRAIAVRKQTPALRLGDFEPVASPEGTLTFRRLLDGDVCTVLVNFTGDPVEVPVEGSEGATVVLASDDAAPEVTYRGVLGPDQAVVLSHVRPGR